MHNADVSRSLQLAESDFLTALESGTNVLASYYQRWSVLLDVLRTASKTGSIGHETLSLACSVASRIAIIASCFLDIKRLEESCTTSFWSDCNAMLSQMAALDLDSQPSSSQLDNRNHTSCSRSCARKPVFLNTENSSPQFVALAHQWLLDNLHNPYPTAIVKAQIAAASSCQVSSINSWFINVRRRIGWTALCRERFSNCRADMIDAAYRALVEENPKRTLPPEFRHSFAAMKVVAEDLYSSTFTRSAFAGHLDGITKDRTDQDRDPTEVGKRSQVEQVNLTRVRRERGIQTRGGVHRTNRERLQMNRESYLSPDQSTTASPVLTLDTSKTDKSKEEEDIAPSIITGTKRRRSSEESDNQPSTSVRQPTVKRLRTSAISRTHLPSPPSSTDGIDVPSDDNLPELPLVQSMQPEANSVSLSRKRRLSDTDTARISKRPRDSTPAPGLHATSGPLPSSSVENEHSIDDWFNTNFDTLFTIPPPVDAAEPDFSASWEVELFRDYCIPGSPKHALKCPPASMPYIEMSAPVDFSDLDNLLQSIGGDISATPPENTSAPYTASFDSSTPDISQPPLYWQSFLDYPDVHQPSSVPQPLPEIDVSMPQLPCIASTTKLQGDLALRQTKLRQLHAMQEAVKRMEQELQAEGIVT